MATVHVNDVMRWLAQSGHDDATPWSSEFFFEIRFDESDSPSVEDEEMKNKVITADSPQGNVTITFDEHGLLRSLDIS